MMATKTFLVREDGEEVPIGELVDEKFPRDEQRKPDIAQSGSDAAVRKKMLIARHQTFVIRDEDGNELSQQVDDKFSREEHDLGTMDKKKMLIGRHQTFMARDDDDDDLSQLVDRKFSRQDDGENEEREEGDGRSSAQVVLVGLFCCMIGLF